MAIKRSHREADLQRKLKVLEYQLYGKKEKLDVRMEKLDNEVGSLNLDQISNFQSQNLSSNLQHLTSSSDLTYLKQDLTKIFILASLAIAAEALFYFERG